MTERGATEFDEVLARLIDGANPTAADVQTLSDLDSRQQDSLRSSWSILSRETRSTVVSDAIAISDTSVHFKFTKLGHVALGDEVPGIRLMAVEVLREALDWTSAKKLEATVAKDPDESVAAAAGEVLGSYVLGMELNRIDANRGRGLVTTLRTVAGDASRAVNVRAAAVGSLGASSEAWVDGVIMDALYEAEPVLRLAAIKAMGASADPKWLEYLVDQSVSDDAEFREAAAISCGEISSEDAIEPLTVLLQDGALDVVEAAIRALGNIGGELAIETLTAFEEVAEKELGPNIKEAKEAAEVSMFEIDREETDW